jgi:pimeloyl-ACP methyl ester carboxylesterase
MPKVEVNHIAINYEVYGDGDPLVMIMGLGGAISAWSRQIPELSEKYRVIVFDNRGAGASDKPDVEYSIGLFARDTVGLLDRLNIGQAHILGVSMGGMIAQEIALNYPERVRSLVLCCTSCGWKESIHPPEEVLQTLMAREGLSPEEIARQGLPFIFTDDYIKNYPEEIEKFIALELENPQPIYAFNRQLAAVMMFDSSSRLKEIKAPTLVLTGREDILVPPQNSRLLAEKIPSAELLILDGGAHCFFWEISAKFNRAVLNFLDKY